MLSLGLLVSCGDDDPGIANNNTVPSAQNFTQLKTLAYNNLKQEFTGNASNPSVTFTSAQGVKVTLYSSCLKKNGQAVTGNIDIEFVEVFNRGNMLTANKPTMGVPVAGQQSLLISGGEIYINVTQNGQAITTECGYELSIPVNLTGGTDNAMTTFTGTVASDGSVLWSPADMEIWIGNDEQNPAGNVFYNAFVNSFGWFNCDKFANFSGPMTDIEVIVPSGYNTGNSNIFVAVQGEPNALGTLSGQYPVGLAIHLIFVTADTAGNWRYAVKTMTLTADASTIFTASDLNTVTEAQLISLINDLP